MNDPLEDAVRAAVVGWNTLGPEKPDQDAAAFIAEALRGVVHACPPGDLIFKFDGGRGAMLCPTCRTIVGYFRAPGREVSR